MEPPRIEGAEVPCTGGFILGIALFLPFTLGAQTPGPVPTQQLARVVSYDHKLTN